MGGISMSFLKKKSLLFCVGAGTGCALALTALLLMPFAWAIRGELLPESAGWLCASLSAGIGVLVPTAVICHVRRRQTLATGAAIAGGLLALAALCCALGGEGYSFGLWLGALAAALLAGGLAGAVLSVRRSSHKKHRR